jgi:heme A synthase
VSSAPAIHYLHRFLAWLTLGYALFLWSYLRRSPGVRPALARAASWLAVSVFVQFNLGALTVLSRVRLELAVAHQVMAYLLLSCAVLLLHRAYGSGARNTNA